MSFAHLLRGRPVPNIGEKATFRRQHLNNKRPVEAQIEHGQRAIAHMVRRYGQTRADELLEGMVAEWSRNSTTGAGGIHCDPIDVDADEEKRPAKRCCWGFWRSFLEDEIGLQYTARQRKHFHRALVFVARRRLEGAKTQAAMRGARKRGSFRGDGGALNSRLAPGLGHALLQYFVDHVQRLMCRSDSTILMNRARELRAELARQGHPSETLPKLIGDAGRAWLMRWRRMYGIERRMSWMKLKVSWKKVKARIRIHLSNIFRLRYFWEHCHPGVPMRFLSLDQKPSWFNNAGLTGTFARKGRREPTVRENHAATRSRYTVLTSVPSWGHDDPDVPPKVAVLFKAAPDGPVLRKLKGSESLVSWTKVQTQVHGSYRSSDMVEALEWMLPNANVSSESIVVMLDWFSGHLTEEVAAKVRDKGHVLIFHGGGCTPWTQVNDTHLHALLARFLVQVENDWSLSERERLISMGQNRTPEKTRETVISLVKQAWATIDHAKVARTGYLQTGPNMPLYGRVRYDEVYKDLRHVMDAISEDEGRPLDPEFVDMTIRDEAFAFVQDGIAAGRWTQWSDCTKLIEEHTSLEEALAEGLEAFDTAAQDGDGEDEGDAEERGDSDDDDDHPDAGGGGGGGGRAAEGGGDAEAGDGEEGGSDGGGADAAAGAAGFQPRDADGARDATAAAARGGDVAAARMVLYNDALKRGDDVLLKRLRNQMREEDRDAKDASTKVGVLLRQRAEALRAEEAKRRRVAREKERDEAIQLEDRKTARANAEKAAHEARLITMQQSLRNRRYLEARKRADILERERQRWLQLTFPVTVAERCIAFFQKVQGSKKASRAWRQEVERLLGDNVFKRMLTVPNLWESIPNFTHEFAQVLPFCGPQHRRAVRCGLPFQTFLDHHFPPSRLGGRDVVDALQQLFSACVPKARDISMGSYTFLRMLHLNGYVMEKTFLYGIICLSKWVGHRVFPEGLYGSWPPELPHDLQPNLPPPIAPIPVEDP